jgi:threonine aldolase
MLWFYSDNTGGCSPQIIEALQGACQGEVRPYGFDEYTQQLDCVFSQVFETKAWVVPVTSGIAANCIGLQAIAAPFSSIVCHEKAHVYAVERGAVEFYTQGARLVPLPGEQGCIDIDQLEKAVSADQAMPGHMPWSALTVTQLNDVGVAYSTDRLRALCDLAHSRGARVHMDGSRFANALACLGCSPADMSWKAGVDVLSFGATKNGTMLADAIVTFDEELCRHMRNNLRRMAQNPSKSRFLSVQLLAMRVMQTKWPRA